MRNNFDKSKILNNLIGPYEHYCFGSLTNDSYLNALVISKSKIKKTINHSIPNYSDLIVAFDKAEISNAYLGQINLITVSSFSGPHGLIWGYDLAKKEDLTFPESLHRKFKKFKDIKIKNAKNLREAAIALFGTKEEKHFPFFPGSYLPCANKIYTNSGPTILYGLAGIGIPENRTEEASLFIEDAGEIDISKKDRIEFLKEDLIIHVIENIIIIGKNQGIHYNEIFVDFDWIEVKADELGCILVAIPYFLLAKKAITENLINQNIEDWKKETQNNFICNTKL